MFFLVHRPSIYFYAVYPLYMARSVAEGRILSQWESSVQQREGYKPMQRRMMLLSPETLMGLRITGIPFE